MLTRSYGLRLHEVVDRLPLSLGDEIRPEDPQAWPERSSPHDGPDFANAVTNAAAMGTPGVVTFDKRAAERLGWRLAESPARPEGFEPPTF